MAPAHSRPVTPIQEVTITTITSTASAVEPPTTPTTRSPKQKRAKHATRDHHVQVDILLRAGHNYGEIVTPTGLTYEQVAYAARTYIITPQKRSGRPPILNDDQVKQLIEFICASKYNRQLPYYKIPTAIGWKAAGFDPSDDAIRGALQREGFKRYVALRKPPISEPTRVARLQFALDHKDWTIEQWKVIIWSDETWVTAGNHRKTRVTRRKDEAYNPTCIVERVQRKQGWMFWGRWSGLAGKGPCIFWEREWGTIGEDSYRQRVLPLICGWNRLNPGHIFMQDNAPAHKAAGTTAEFEARRIILLKWPPYSPDLNIIEAAWNWTKDYIAQHFPEKMSYDQLWAAIYEAWEAIPPEFFNNLLHSLPERMAAVIAANGMYTKY